MKKDGTVFYVVEEGVPIPAPRTFNAAVKRAKRNLYPFQDMRVNDSFLVPGDKGQRLLFQAGHAWTKRRNLPWKFLVRRMGDGNFRIWRTE